LLLRPGDRGVGIEASAHTTVVEVVDDVVEDVEDVGEVDVVDVEQVVDGVVVSTADAGDGPYGPKNRSDMATSIETKRIFFINQTIVMFMK
jgi:3-dehydroquinate synthase class II